MDPCLWSEPVAQVQSFPGEGGATCCSAGGQISCRKYHEPHMFVARQTLLSSNDPHVCTDKYTSWKFCDIGQELQLDFFLHLRQRRDVKTVIIWRCSPLKSNEQGTLTFLGDIVTRVNSRDAQGQRLLAKYTLP